MEASEVVGASGHIIDSGILNSIFDAVIRHGGSFEVQQFKIGRTNDEPSLLKMVVKAPQRAALDALLHDLVPLGCVVKATKNVVTREADLDGCAPVDFYSTTNHQTHVRVGGKCNTTFEVEGNEMQNNGVYLEVVPNEKLVFTDAYTVGWKPAPEPFMTAILTFEDLGGGRTKYTAIARHRNADTAKAHKDMGFYDGWGTVVTQLEEYAQGLK